MKIRSIHYRWKPQFLIIAICRLAFSISFTQLTAIAEDWVSLGNDLESVEIDVDSKSLVPSSVLFVRTTLNHLRIGVVRAREFGWNRAGVKAMVKKSGAIVGINSNFFDPSGAPLGLIISRGTSYQSIHKGGKTLTGLLQINATGPMIVSRSKFIPAGVIEAVQAGPRLIVGGVPSVGIANSSQVARRAGVCIDQHRRLLLFISRGIAGLSFADLQNLLLSEPIGCRDGLNFDGGGSAQLYLNTDRFGGRSELDIDGRDEVPVMVALFASS